ncbi:MAG: hypothetical protein K5665_08815 [Saccharofermentans sp.]|nr:hypothetical protein [Saccharofermentans sp.]
MDIDERIVLSDTPEKYSEMAKVIVPPFLKLMKEIVALEDGAWKIDEVRYGFGEKDKWFIDHI